MENPAHAMAKNNFQGQKAQSVTWLRWLEPGTVKSRNLKPRKHRGRQPKETQKEDNSDSSSVQSEELVKSSHFDLIDLAGRDLNTLKWAVEYLHEFWYPKMNPLKDLRVREWVRFISPQTFQGLASMPYYIQDAMICMAIFQQRAKYNKNDYQAKALLTQSLYARGRMIRSLSADLSNPDKRTGMMVFAGIFQLLYNDLARGFSDGWRYHFAAAYKLMRMKGGLLALTQDPDSQLLIRAFLYTGVVGDTSSPPTEQALAPQDINHLEALIEVVEGMGYVLTIYPAFFFGHCMRINQLRALAADRKSLSLLPDPDTQAHALVLLDEIRNFSVETWAETKGALLGDNLLLGQIYKSALYIFSILSLQSVSVLPSRGHNADLLAQIVFLEAESLAELIEHGMPNQKIKLLLVSGLAFNGSWCGCSE